MPAATDATAAPSATGVSTLTVRQRQTQPSVPRLPRPCRHASPSGSSRLTAHGCGDKKPWRLLTRPTRPGCRDGSLKLSVKPYNPAYPLAPSMATAIFIVPPPLRTGRDRPHQRAPQFLLQRPPPVPECTDPTNGYQNLLCADPSLSTSLYQPYPRVRQSLLQRPPLGTSLGTGPTNGYRNLHCAPPPPSVPARTDSTHGFRNLYCKAPSQDQPVPAPPTGTEISIAQPPPVSVSACTSPSSGYGSLYYPAPSSVPICSTLTNGSSNKAASSQWRNFSNNQSFQGCSSQQLAPPLRSRTPFRSNHSCRFHNPAPVHSKQHKYAPRTHTARWQRELASSRHLPHHLTCRW